MTTLTLPIEVTSRASLRFCDGYHNRSTVSDHFICPTLPMPDEDGGISDADMIVYFDTVSRVPGVARTYFDDGEAAEYEFEVVAVGWDGIPGAPITDADKLRILAWFEDHYAEACAIAEDDQP